MQIGERREPWRALGPWIFEGGGVRGEEGMGGQQERLNTVPHLQNGDITDWIWHIVGFQQMGIILK